MSITENDISFSIRGAIFNVYKKLGPGLLESAYEAALSHELTKLGFSIRRQVKLPLIYDDITIDAGYRIDMMVDEKVIVEIKSVETIMDVHHKQVLTYLRLSGLKLGILVNFNSPDVNKTIYRKVNNLA